MRNTGSLADLVCVVREGREGGLRAPIGLPLHCEKRLGEGVNPVDLLRIGPTRAGLHHPALGNNRHHH